jgi:hypothetical protein
MWFSYPDDRYAHHLERVHSYLDAPSRPYSGASESKHSYSALDDVPRYVDPTLRNSRARLDYDVSAWCTYLWEPLQPRIWSLVHSFSFVVEEKRLRKRSVGM